MNPIEKIFCFEEKQHFKGLNAMKILHYALGLPPYRTGGMTKFCLDLMVQQNMDGHQAAMIWPGKIGLINKKISVIDRGSAALKDKEINIHNFEIINPLPISYDEGIKQFDVFMYDAGKGIYRQFLHDFQPDILHVHTLMGLHKSLIAVSKEMGIRLVYTAHDFFPVCPKVTMFRNGEICRTADSCEECSACNSTALGIKKMQMLQSPLYRRLKDNAVVRKMRKRHRDNYLKENSQAREEGVVGTAADYKKLRKYYNSLLDLMDMIHYNSSVTKRVYEAYMGCRNGCVIGISHADIMDCKKIKEFSKDILRIRYLGPCGGAKGFFLLKAALDKLWNENKSFCLDVHFQPAEMSPYIKVHERYTYEELQKIFQDTDVLIVPSIWYETFGYTVLEALSAGVPVILSGTVGARDILEEGTAIIIDDINCEKLYSVVRNLSAEKLAEMNRIIVEKQKIMTVGDMAIQIERKCYFGT